MATASPIGVKMAEVALTWSMDTAVRVLRDTQALTAKQVRLTMNIDHYIVLIMPIVIECNEFCKLDTLTETRYMMKSE